MHLAICLSSVQAWLISLYIGVGCTVLFLSISIQSSERLDNPFTLSHWQSLCRSGVTKLLISSHVKYRPDERCLGIGKGLITGSVHVTDFDNKVADTSAYRWNF